MKNSLFWTDDRDVYSKKKVLLNFLFKYCAIKRVSKDICLIPEESENDEFFRLIFGIFFFLENSYNQVFKLCMRYRSGKTFGSQKV